jgi:signal transduction histidine kinase
VHPEDAERVHQYRDLMLANNEDFSYECRIVRQDGEERYLDISAESLHDNEDNVIGVLGTMQDITERKEVEKLKDEFISTVSHELRTPLTSIRGSLGLVRGLATSDDMPEKITSLLEIAHNNTERLLHLINDILDISKIESGQLSLSYSRIQLQDFLEQAVINNQHYAEDVDIIFTDDVGDLQIEADSERLMQIMNNLISNACKFSPKGSKVELGVKLANHGVEISVRDYGDGIPEKYQAKLFEKFTQADSSNTRNFNGTGLGLSITKALVEKHGGYIGFESEKGRGTRFYFVLPTVID